MQLLRTFITFFYLVVFIVKIYAQNPVLTKDTIKTAPVDVTVIDSKKAPRQGEKIIFTGQKTGKFFQGRTNKAGKLSIALPVGDEYAVVLYALTDSTHFGTLPIPPLAGTQFYKDPFVVEIKYEPAKVFTLNDVHFDFGKATLREESFKQLDELYEYLKWKETCKVEIAGHTDNVGADNENLFLSQKRAETVKAWLVKKGIQPARIIAKGYGANRPVADNTTEEGRQQNRRTEVIIL